MSDLTGMQPIRVLIVDDSAIVRKAVTDALKPDKEIEIVGTAANGKIALEKIVQLNPDVLVLDIEMPICDGFEVLRLLREQRIRIRTIMFSTLTERGATQTIKALSLGANDYVPKPSSESNITSYSDGVKKVAAELTPKIKQFRRRVPVANGVSNPVSNSIEIAKRTTIMPMRDRSGPFTPPQIVAIGISTGGPEALAKVLPNLPASFPVPIVIVQHMPALFTKLLAERLNNTCKIKVVEGAEGLILQPGVAYIAPGDYHLLVKESDGKFMLSVNQGPPENSCRPAADVLFRSVADVYGKRALGVIMTGMGHDGLKGLRIMHAKGASVIAQDEASSVVWGMPSGVVQEGLADKVLPVDQLAGSIERSVMMKSAATAQMG